LTFTFGNAIVEGEDAWLIPCKHTLFPPALREQIIAVEESLGSELPRDYVNFLRITNGAELYVASLAWKPSWSSQENYVEYLIYSTEQLVALNRNLLQDFRAMLGNDPDFRSVQKLNYIAFCDAHDGNYLAILLEGARRGNIFFLDKEYMFRPYSEIDANLYYTIAQSFEGWLKLVAETKGTGGPGETRL
jgi:hypothetical protein